ncbi:hypothetical protein [Actinoallomurus oryzae]
MTVAIEAAPQRHAYFAWPEQSYPSRIDAMAMKKLSITLPAELAEMVRRQAEEEGTSVSAVIAEELAAAARRRAGAEAVRWFVSEEGPFTEEDRAAARAILDAADEHQRKLDELAASEKEAG